MGRLITGDLKAGDESGKKDPWGESAGKSYWTIIRFLLQCCKSPDLSTHTWGQFNPSSSHKMTENKASGEYWNGVGVGTCPNCPGGECQVLQAHTPLKDLHELSELKSRRETNLFCPTLSLHNLRDCLVRWRPPSTLLYRNLLVPIHVHPLFSNVTIWGI